MKYFNFIIIFLISLFFLSGIFAYPHLPEQMASHWNSIGEVNGYMSKFWGVFLLPLIAVILFALLYFIPRLDPLKENINHFKTEYQWFIVGINLFLLAIYVWTLLWNLGMKINSNVIMPVGIAFLFYDIAKLLSKTKRNHFIGIRTPWTLSSDIVWDKTHLLASKLFQISSLIVLIGILFSQWAWLFMLVPIIANCIYIIIYSYYVFKHLKEEK